MDDLRIQFHVDGRGRCFASVEGGSMAGDWCRTAEAAFSSLAEKARTWLELKAQIPWKQVVEDDEVAQFVLLQRVFKP